MTRIFERISRSSSTEWVCRETGFSIAVSIDGVQVDDQGTNHIRSPEDVDQLAYILKSAIELLSSFDDSDEVYDEDRAVIDYGQPCHNCCDNDRCAQKEATSSAGCSDGDCPCSCHK